MNISKLYVARETLASEICTTRTGARANAVAGGVRLCWFAGGEADGEGDVFISRGRG